MSLEGARLVLPILPLLESAKPLGEGFDPAAFLGLGALVVLLFKMAKLAFQLLVALQPIECQFALLGGLAHSAIRLRLVLAIRKIAGTEFPGFTYFVGSLIAGVLWPVLCFLLKLPQRPTPDPDDV